MKLVDELKEITGSAIDVRSVIEDTIKDKARTDAEDIKRMLKSKVFNGEYEIHAQYKMATVSFMLGNIQINSARIGEKAYGKFNSLDSEELGKMGAKKFNGSENIDPHFYTSLCDVVDDSTRHSYFLSNGTYTNHRFSATYNQPFKGMYINLLKEYLRGEDIEVKMLYEVRHEALFSHSYSVLKTYDITDADPSIHYSYKHDEDHDVCARIILKARIMF